MPIDADQLRQRYESLSEDELIDLDRNLLTEIAQKCYDQEIKRRGISLPIAGPEENGPKSAVKKNDETFVACSFTDLYRWPDHPASRSAEEARNALEAAGIPCRIDPVRVQPEPDLSPYNEYRVVIPDACMLRAMSVLDKQVFNPRQEADWKTHLQSLSDDQLAQLNVDDICAGLVDRAARLRKAYVDEQRRRQSY
jgi:hypothetical protein